MKYIFLFSLLSVCTISCHKSKKSSFLGAFTNYYNGSPKELSKYPIDSLGKPEYIYAWKNHIIIADPIDDYLLSSYDLQSNQFYRFLSRGSGPEELIDIQQMGAVDDHRFFIKSTFGNNLHLYSVNENKNILTNMVKNILPEFVSITIDNNMLIGSYKGTSRFAISELDNIEFKKEFGEDVESFSQEMASNTLQGLSVGSPNQKKIAWFSFYGEVAEFYDYSDTTNIHCFKKYVGDLPIVNEQYVFNEGSKLGITSLTKSDKYVFALYSGKTLEEIMASNKDLGLLSNRILVYNWDGDSIGVLNLDKKVRSISYNIESDVLYMVGYDENSYEYNISYIDDINLVLNNH